MNFVVKQLKSLSITNLKLNNTTKLMCKRLLQIQKYSKIGKNQLILTDHHAEALKVLNRTMLQYNN